MSSGRFVGLGRFQGLRLGHLAEVVVFDGGFQDVAKRDDVEIDRARVCAIAEPFIAERGNVARFDSVEARVAKMRFPSVERLPLILKGAGFLRGDVRLGEVCFDVVGELRLVPARREHVFAPVVADVRGFLRLREIRHRNAVRREQGKLPRGLRAILTAHPKLRVVAPVADVDARNSAIARIPDADKLRARNTGKPGWRNWQTRQT